MLKLTQENVFLGKYSVIRRYRRQSFDIRDFVVISISKSTDNIKYE